MRIGDRRDGYGLVTRVLHWLMAIAIPALFVLGLWMVSLDYTSPYYNLAPDIHRSAGVLLLFLLMLRFFWRIANPKPGSEELSPFEAKASHIVHWGFYPLLLALMVSGYLISTAKGEPISVFGWFDVPAVLALDNQETVAGQVHEILAYVTLALATVHTIAALKHHFRDKSRILTRMWSGPPAG